MSGGKVTESGSKLGQLTQVTKSTKLFTKRRLIYKSLLPLHKHVRSTSPGLMHPVIWVSQKSQNKARWDNQVKCGIPISISTMVIMVYLQCTAWQELRTWEGSVGDYKNRDRCKKNRDRSWDNRRWADHWWQASAAISILNTVYIHRLTSVSAAHNVFTSGVFRGDAGRLSHPALHSLPWICI